MTVFSLTVTTVIFVLASTAGAQQGTAELRGTVRDEQGAVLRHVGVTVRHMLNGTVRQTATNPDGSYVVSGLTPGVYVIEAALPGFARYAQADVRLEVGRTTVLDLSLTVGSVDMAVVVEGQAPVLDVTSKEITGHITAQELTDLPSMNRSFVGFLTLLPGLVPSITSDSFGSEAVTLNGIDSRNINYLMDGANNNDDFLGQRAGTQARTPIEAIQEFEVLTHQFDAEFGRTTGAIANAVTKQGSNAFHGSAFWFFQNDRMTARDFFARQNDVPKVATELQQYGGTLGGPVVRDKAHFFASVESVRQVRAASVNIPARPDLNTAVDTTGRVWNTLARFDHQPSIAHTWSVRWLRESSPQANLLIPVAGRQVTLNASREESDVDHTMVGTLQSVAGNRLTNTLRVAWTRENVAFANPGFNGNGRRQDLLPPTLQYLTFIDQQSDVAQARVGNGYSADLVTSWFVPERFGTHDLKFGIQYHFATIDISNQGTLNGLFEFPTNASFNAADPATYPERLQVRVPGAADVYLNAHFASAFAHDKWRIGNRLTLTIGARYDLEFVPIHQDHNPAISDGEGYPVDADNIAPRLGFAYALDDANRSVLRGGYGVFYDKTHLELIAPIVTAGVYSDSFIALFPANAADPGPSRGELPAEPLLRNGPILDAALVGRLFPPGARIRNTGTVFVDNPERRVPKTHQVTIGYQRQIGAATSARVDYIHARGRDLLMTRDLNPGVRIDTSRTGAVVRVDPEFTGSVLQPVNAGAADYDALEVLVDRRLGSLFGGKVSYTFSHSRGNTSGNGAPQLLLQRLDDLNLEAHRGPTDFDRRHHFVISGTMRVPRTGGLFVSAVARAISGLPFTVIDSRVDADQNGILFDLLPAGTYEGTGRNSITVEYNGKRNGATGPGFFQLDMRVGYRFPAGRGRTFDAFGEIFNLTGRANFDNPVTSVLGHPVADRRMTDFLLLRTLRPGGIPRTGQVGIRFAF